MIARSTRGIPNYSCQAQAAPGLNRQRLYLALSAAIACGLAAQSGRAQDDPRPLETRWQLDYNGSVELGAAYVSDENFEFGEYNGLNEDEATLIGNVNWSSVKDGKFLDFSATDLGLDTREGRASWRNDRWELFFEYDGQQQVRNNSGRTPFRGSDVLTLPEDWVSANTTGGFSNLDDSLRGFDQEIDRDRYTLGIAAKIGQAWRIEGSAFYEEKEGDRDLGAAIFQNAGSGEAVILPQQVDQETTEFDLAVSYARDGLALNGSLFYSDFDGADEILQWQNPYSSFGPNVRYPAGFGGISTAPDNEFYQARLMGTYILSPSLRFQVDGSFGKTEQDQNFLDYTVNPNLVVTEPLPRENLDGETETKVLDARVFWRPLRKLNLEGYFHGEERDFDQPRDGYRYVLGDATNQVESARQLYNTAHDYSSNEVGVEGSYPLPLRSKLWLTYEYEEIERDNAAVKKTEEDRYGLRYRLPILSNLSMRLEGLYGDRAADRYQWAQSYYARLDVERINATPDNQRYSNHPLLSQYHLSNRERTEMKLDLDWQPGMAWNLALNLLYREDDYGESELGLTDEELNRAGLTLSWVPNSRLTLSGYTSYNSYESEQSGRSFRGGIEKNAFEVEPPLPQASDPARNWDVDVEDEVLTVGLNAEWRMRDDITLTADYSYVDTDSDYDFKDGGGAGMSSEPLPADNETEQHHVMLEGIWHYRENVSIRLNYQYWNYDSTDWAINGVAADSIDKVLTLGEQEADEDLHYIGTSIIYRWQ